MPPKRKFADDTPKVNTRHTRSSARTKASSAKHEDENVSVDAAAKRTARARDAGDDDDPAGRQPKKRARISKAVGEGKKKPVKRSENARSADQESGASGQTPVDDGDHKVKQTESAPPPTKDEPYTPQRALSFFNAYADPDEPNAIGPEGFEKLCSDAGLSMEGAMPLILAWQLEAQEMARISKEEWIKSTGTLRISSLRQLSVALTDLENLLIYGKPPVQKSKKEPYERRNYWSYTSDVNAVFRKLYIYCFQLVKPSASKNIEMETAVAIWSVLLAPKFPLMREILEYINEKGTYRAANKDLWNMMLEFCETVTPNLDNYEADGAWPTLLDEFASWKKGKSTA